MLPTGSWDDGECDHIGTGKEWTNYFSPPVTRAPTGHLLAKHSQRPRSRLGVFPRGNYGPEQRSVRAGRGSKRQHDPHKLSENDWVGYYRYCSFETRSCYAAQTGLKFLAVIPVLLPESWDYGHMPLKECVLRNKLHTQAMILQ